MCRGENVTSSRKRIEVSLTNPSSFKIDRPPLAKITPPVEEEAMVEETLLEEEEEGTMVAGTA